MCEINKNLIESDQLINNQNGKIQIQSTFDFLVGKLCEHLLTLAVTNKFITIDDVRKFFENTIFYPIAICDEVDEVIIYFQFPRSFYEIKNFPFYLLKISIQKTSLNRRVKFCKKWIDSGRFSFFFMPFGKLGNSIKPDLTILSEVLTVYEKSGLS